MDVRGTTSRNLRSRGDFAGSGAAFLCIAEDPDWDIDCESLYGLSCSYCGWDKIPNKPKDVEQAIEIGRPCFFQAFCETFVAEAATDCAPPSVCDGY